MILQSKLGISEFLIYWYKIDSKPIKMNIELFQFLVDIITKMTGWGSWDLNPESPTPEAGIITKLYYHPSKNLRLSLAYNPFLIFRVCAGFHDYTVRFYGYSLLPSHYLIR